MMISDLLNRMELLYPDNPILSDIRRAYIDKDPSSIFRVIEAMYPDKDLDDLRKAFMSKNTHSMFRLLATQFGDQYNDLRLATLDEPDLNAMFRVVADGLPAGGDFAVELKKACLDQNYYSLFRLIDTEEHNYFDLDCPEGLKHNDFKKFVLNDNKWSMWRVIHYFQPNFVTEWMRRLTLNEIEWNTDSLAQGQLNSKIWATEELKRLDLDLGTVFLCAGWYGLLASIMFDRGLKIEKIRSFDIDPEVAVIAELANNSRVIDGWQFRALTQDIHSIDFDQHRYELSTSDGKVSSQCDSPDTVINTSCEHIERFDEWYAKIPDGKLVLLQTNDFEDLDEHVNTVSSLEEFAAQTPMREVLYQGELPTLKYTRFMRIGRK